MYSPILGRFVSRDPSRSDATSESDSIANSGGKTLTVANGYKDGLSMYQAYFVPNDLDWNGEGKNGPERYLALGASGFGFSFGILRNDPSGAWQAVIEADAKSVQIEAHYLMGHMVWARPAAESAIQDWMKDDKSQGGCECKSIMLVGNSWGALNSTVIAQWFQATYGFKARIHIIIEGVSRNTRPYNHIGPAEIMKNYYSSESHWPRGAPIDGAQNIDISGDPGYKQQRAWGNGAHIAAEWAGKDLAVADLIGSVNPQCGH